MKTSWQILTMLATGWLLASCSGHMDSPETSQTQDTDKQIEKKETPQEEASASEKETSASEKETSAIEPTPEQQQAAEKLLSTAELPEEFSDDTQNVLPESLGDEEIIDEGTHATGIPGGRNLRMVQYTPPEEAASTENVRTPRPNRAEQHGFRSPLLPSKLPMDINGKLTSERKD